MSANEFYLNKGFTPTWKAVSFDGVGTLTVWTPRTSTRIVLTQLLYAATLAGSSALYWGNLAGDKILEFRHGGSYTVNFDILVDSGTMDRTLVANSLAPGTDGVKITAFGFEIPM